MKKAFASCLFAALLLSSCSLLQRNSEDFEDESAPPFDPAESAATVEEDPGMTQSSSSIESEVSRLNTKISALETKLDVLSASVERNQVAGSQPVIHAEASPQANMAVPVEVSEEPIEESTVQMSAAPARTSAMPVAVKSPNPSTPGAEKEFQGAMELFQGGKNLEAASRFALFAKKYPRHLMASHALYWAGEASARAQQWSLAMENWEELEKSYPRSAYLPEALAGLARANESQGNSAKAKTYRDTLARAFPRSPTTLSLQSSRPAAAQPSRSSHAPQVQAGDDAGEEIPNYDESPEEAHE